MDRDDEGCLRPPAPSARTWRTWSALTTPQPNWTGSSPTSWVGCPDPSASARRLRILLEQHEDNAWFLGRVLAGAPDYRRSHRHRIPPRT